MAELVNISLSPEAKAKMPFDEFKRVFGRHFIGKKETVEKAYTRLTGRDARTIERKIETNRPVEDSTKNRQARELRRNRS